MNQLKKQQRLLKDINRNFDAAFMRWSRDMFCIEIPHEEARKLSKRIELCLAAAKGLEQ